MSQEDYIIHKSAKDKGVSYVLQDAVKNLNHVGLWLTSYMINMEDFNAVGLRDAIADLEVSMMHVKSLFDAEEINERIKFKVDRIDRLRRLDEINADGS